MTRTIKVERKISPAAKMVVEDFNQALISAAAVQKRNREGRL